jgi:threonine/homoserine/homoserine lactone efflux protein
MFSGNFFGTHDYFAFLLAAIALNILPGQDSLYILGRSLSQGRTAGIVSMLGVGAGCLVHITAAAIGLYAVLALWPMAFTAITVLGALYLIWLGISTWAKRKERLPGVTCSGGPGSSWVIYRQGFLTNLLNPKVALFFIAFLPSFIDPGTPYGPLSFLFLGCTFLFTGTVWCLILVLGASAFAGALRHNPKIQAGFDLFASIVFILLGVGILLTHLSIG